jgi:hypothetical protein
LKSFTKIIWVGTLILIGIVIYSKSLQLTTSNSLNDKNFGIHAEDFALLDHTGTFQHLYENTDVDAVVLYSHGIGCPIVRQQINTIKNIDKLFQGKVRFFFINANPQDLRNDLQKDAKDYQLNYPILDDDSQMIAKSIGIDRTGLSIIINPKTKRIIWQGPINDKTNYYLQKQKASSNFLKDALSNHLDGKLTEYSNTKSLGCAITFDQKFTTNYSKDIAPILISKCLYCHRENGIASFPMTNYKKINGWSQMIREVVRTRRMPPWGIDETFGGTHKKFYLEPLERKKILSWIENGSQRDDGVDPLVAAHKKLAPLNSWKQGTPDLILEIPRQKIPPEANLPYRYITINIPIKKDRWIKGLEFLPTNHKVLHHALVFYFESGKGLNERPNGNVSKDRNMLGGHAPGVTRPLYPENSGYLLKKGSHLTIEMHYKGIGKSQEDNPKIGLYFSKKPEKLFNYYIYSDLNIKIKPYEKIQRVTGILDIDLDGTIHAITPHMHYRGYSQRYFHQDHQGNKVELLHVPRFDFNYQNAYSLIKPIKVKAGSKIICEAIYNNSPENPANPDPSKEVSYGVNVENEMLWFGVDFAYEKK